MRNQYKNLGKFVFCLNTPKFGDPDTFTLGKKYKIIDNYSKKIPIIIIENNYGGKEIFNIHSPFGDCFCSLTYLRKKKLEQLKI